MNSEKNQIWKWITIISIIASLIAIYSFFSGNQNIYQVIDNSKNIESITHYTKVSAANIDNGVYVKPCFLRKWPSLIQAIFGIVTLFIGGGDDIIYTVKDNTKSVFLAIPYIQTSGLNAEGDYPFQVRLSPSKKRFIINLHNNIHIAYIDGTHHSEYSVDGGYIENLAFITNNCIKINVRQDPYYSQIMIGQFVFYSSGLHTIKIDKTNILID